ncbi:MAG TPA: hypothetical protein DHU79_06930 [Clostridiales bacterium]|nr:hypothetical protein [Clostridiales bacterium]
MSLPWRFDGDFVLITKFYHKHGKNSTNKLFCLERRPVVWYNVYKICSAAAVRAVTRLSQHVLSGFLPKRERTISKTRRRR